jgi:moderate conductance mechanosensitive channel
MKANLLLRWTAALVFSVAPLLPASAATAPSKAAPAASPATSTAPSTAQLQQLVSTLKDDKARAALIDQLQALIAAQQGAPLAPSPPPSTWLGALPGQLDALGAEILAAVPVLVQAPRLVAWIGEQVTNPDLRQTWLDIFGKLAIIFGVGFAADLLVRLLLRRPAKEINARTGAHVMGRLLLLLAAAVIEILPIASFLLVASLVLPLTHPQIGTRGVAEALITAAIWAGGVLALARAALLSPAAQALYPLTGETRNYLYIWARRFAYWAAYGYAASIGSWWLGAPGAIDGLLMRITALVLAILGIIFILQNRLAVRDWLHAHERTKNGRWRFVCDRLGDTWHVLGIGYILGIFGVYALNAAGGFAFILRATVLSLVVVAAAAILARVVEGLMQRGLSVSPALKARFPGLEGRVNRYTAMLRVGVSVAIYGLAALAFLQAWGLDAFTWLAFLAEQPATGSAFSLVVVIIIGLVLWEFVSSLIERRLAGLDSSRRSRARTLLPLLRSVILITLITVIALMVLSELGLNIAPLLAGAGVAGIAVGFGAQTLVKDLITGFFILLEDAFAVGDVVDVGDGHSGIVEAISMRNFRLRDLSGTVHTVPFSMVTTIKNLTRDFSYYLADVEVSYREDTDEVIEVLKAVAEEMRKEPDFSYRMLEPIEIIGVDAFKDSSVVIKVRLKTLPIQQWTVGREFNRRMKKAFDKEGIEIPFPHRTIYFGEDKKGQAPAAHIRVATEAGVPPGDDAAAVTETAKKPETRDPA